MQKSADETHGERNENQKGVYTSEKSKKNASLFLEKHLSDVQI